MLGTATNTHAGGAVFFSTALLSGYPAGSCYTPSHSIPKYSITPEQICDKFSFNHPRNALSLSWPKVQYCSAPTTQPTGAATLARHELEGRTALQNLGVYPGFTCVLCLVVRNSLFASKKWTKNQAPAKEGGYGVQQEGKRRGAPQASHPTLHSC